MVISCDASSCVHKRVVFWAVRTPSRQAVMFALPSQRCLLMFSASVTRVLPTLCFAQYTKIIQKKRKSPEPEPEPSSPPAAPLSSEQLERITRNKRAALERLTSAQTPAGMGEGWRDQLSAQFGKPYFKKVSDVAPPTLKLFSPFLPPRCVPQLSTFVAEERKCRAVYPPADQVFTWTQMCDIRDVSLTAGKPQNTHCCWSEGAI